MIEKQIKALAWKQPYAELMFHGKIETRTWNTHYRGLVLICTSKISYKKSNLEVISGIYQTSRISTLLKCYSIENMLNGHAIGIGELIDCRPMQKQDEDKCFVKYNPDLFCHVYRNVQRIEPFEFKNGQKWKNLTEEQRKQIKII